MGSGDRAEMRVVSDTQREGKDIWNSWISGRDGGKCVGHYCHSSISSKVGKSVEMGKISTDGHGGWRDMCKIVNQITHKVRLLKHEDLGL